MPEISIDRTTRCKLQRGIRTPFLRVQSDPRICGDSPGFPLHSDSHRHKQQFAQLVWGFVGSCRLLPVCLLVLLLCLSFTANVSSLASLSVGSVFVSLFYCCRVVSCQSLWSFYFCVCDCCPICPNCTLWLPRVTACCECPLYCLMWLPRVTACCIASCDCPVWLPRVTARCTASCDCPVWLLYCLMWLPCVTTPRDCPLWLTNATARCDWPMRLPFVTAPCDCPMFVAHAITQWVLTRGSVY